jgi:hypothetical protein
MQRLSLDINPAETQPVLPNFLIAGAAKSGTTSLYYYLKQHPEVFMSPVKEPNFLLASAKKNMNGPGDIRWASQAVKTFDDYLKLFTKGVGKKAIGEASVTTLFHFKQTIPSIHRYIGNPRIIIILRDPVESVYSTYNYMVRQGIETCSFEKALSQEGEKKRMGYTGGWLYKESRLYSGQVRAFQENFSRVTVFLYDDLKRNPAALVQLVYEFLGVDPNFVPDMKHVYNVSGIPRIFALNALFVKPKRLHKMARTMGGAILGKDWWVKLRDRLWSMNLEKPKPIPSEIEQELRHYFRDDIIKLQEYIGRDLSAWLEGKLSTSSGSIET